MSPILADISFGTGIIICGCVALVAVGGYLYAKKKGWV